MTPVEIIERATADGVILELSAGGTITATGAQSAVDKWLPTIRDNKPGILCELQRERKRKRAKFEPTLTNSTLQGEKGATVARCWFVTEAGRKSFEVYFSPPATMSEVLDGRPDSTIATPCEPKPVKAFSPPDINIEPWRDRLWAQLDEKPALNYAIEVALPSDDSPDVEICVVRRGVGTFTILVPRGTMTLVECQLKILELCCAWADS